MRAGIESVPAGTAMVTIGWVNILQVLPLILEYARVLEASTILQPCYIAAEHAGPASLQTAHEDILVFTLIVVLHSRFCLLTDLTLSRAQPVTVAIDKIVMKVLLKITYCRQAVWPRHPLGMV